MEGGPHGPVLIIYAEEACFAAYRQNEAAPILPRCRIIPLRCP